jgi:signal transduction histidine kinase
MTTRLRLFAALAAAAFVGSFVTGLYAVLVDPTTIGFLARAASVAPKALVLAGVLLPALVLGARWTGGRLARSVEDVAAGAVRVAQGEPASIVAGATTSEARRIVESLGSLRREIDRRPHGAAFLRDAWHDLRTPLTAVKACLELLEDGGLEPRDASRFLANAASAADELDRRLEALVTLCRFETAALAPSRPASMRAIILLALARARPLADARQVALEVGPPGSKSSDRVRCDRAALERAMANLVANACAATREGYVRVSCDDDGADSVVVDIVNEPASVPAELRARLFERASMSGTSGTGLGLAIARAAVEAHGGRVRFVEWGPPRVCVRVEVPRGWGA